MNLVMIFNEKRKRNDPQVVDFMVALAVNLRNCKVFEKLAPKD